MKSSKSMSPQEWREADLHLAVLCAVVPPREKLSHRRIAELTGIGRGTVYNIEQHALKKIRERIERIMVTWPDKNFHDGKRLDAIAPIPARSA